MAPRGPGGRLLRALTAGARRWPAGRWCRRHGAPSSDGCCRLLQRPMREGVSRPPQHRRLPGLGCSPSRRRRPSATDGDRGWACSQSPERRTKRTAGSMSRPGTARARGAGVLLNTQAERGQIPSATGPQPAVITTCARGCRGGDSLLHSEGAGGRAEPGLLKRQAAGQAKAAEADDDAAAAAGGIRARGPRGRQSPLSCPPPAQACELRSEGLGGRRNPDSLGIPALGLRRMQFSLRQEYWRRPFPKALLGKFPWETRSLSPTRTTCRHIWKAVRASPFLTLSYYL